MAQAGFQYPTAAQSTAMPANDAMEMHAAPARALAISIYADRPHVRAQMQDDVAAAGFGLAASCGLDALPLAEGAGQPPSGDLVLVDCPVAGGAVLAALSTLDMAMARSCGRLIVSTSVDALDAVFACLDQSGAEILVDPTRAERVVALGRSLGRMADLSVRELAKEDRLVLLRLSEQVSRIADRLDRLAPPANEASGGAQGEGEQASGAFRFESPRPAFATQAEDAGDRLVRSTRPPLPDPALVRRIVRQRQLRARFFDGELFADPAWDMLLDLTAARAEHTRVSVTSLCIASGVPPTTALRWIAQMTEAGLLRRTEDDTDRRRAFITLTERAADAVSRYFAEIGGSAARLV